jgi:O-acetylserine/cysteine efflux transporter
VLLNLMWGGSLPATKVALESFGPLTLAAARLMLAAALFLAVLGPRALGRLDRREMARLAALGVVGFTGTQTLQALGTTATDAATASVLAATAPLWIAVLAVLLLGERLSAGVIVGLVLALVGVAAISGLKPATVSELGMTVRGNGMVLLSGATVALYTVAGKDMVRRHPPLLLSGVSCLGGAIAALPLAALELTAHPPVPTVLGWVMVFYLGVLVTFVGFLVWFWGLQAVSAARAGALMFLQPLSGLALSVLALGDRLTPTFLLGAALVLVGVYVTARPGAETAN